MAKTPRNIASRDLRLFLMSNVLAGLVAGLGQAPFGLWPATVAGLSVGFALWCNAETAKRAFLGGLALGLGYFLLTMNWFVNPFFVEPLRHGWMAPFALLGISGLLGAFWAIASSFARYFLPDTNRFGWVVWALCLTSAELARGWVFTGFPWGGPGLVWLDTPLAQLAATIGVSGLGALTFLVSAAILRVPRSKARVRNAGLLLVSMSLCLFAGLSGEGRVVPADRAQTIRLVQPNAPQHLKWDPDHAFGFLDRQVELTAAPTLLGQKRPDLVVWPETSVPYLLDVESSLLKDFATSAQGAQIALGIQRGEGLRYFNSLAVLSAQGAVTHLYDKHHLVPFGEYIPFGDALQKFGIRAFASQQGRGYSAGQGAITFDLEGLGRVLPIICYEAIFPRDIRAADQRPDWILQLTNDAWFGSFSGPQQHLAQARFRAIEFGLPMVRSANTGISAIIDAKGKIRANIPLGQHGFLDHALPAGLEETQYARRGDLPLTLILLSGWMFLAGRRTRISR